MFLNTLFSILTIFTIFLSYLFRKNSSFFYKKQVIKKRDFCKNHVFLF